MKNIFPFLLFSLFCFSASAQLNYKAVDYTEVDAWVRAINNKKIHKEADLAKMIKTKYPERHLRLRAIYVWVAENISYDCVGLHNKKLARTKSSDVLNQKKSICQGYANLFLELCNQCNIPCEIIGGIAKTNFDVYGKHAWNRVKMEDDKWYLIDATWGAGYADPQCKIYTKKFNDHYYLTPPEVFIYMHYPSKKEMQLLDVPISKKKFKSLPLARDGAYIHALAPATPDNYLITVKANENFHLSLPTMNNSKIDSVSFNIIRKKTITINDTVYRLAEKHIPKMSRSGDEYIIDYSFKINGDFYLEIILNGYPAFEYEVKIKGGEAIKEKGGKEYTH